MPPFAGPPEAAGPWRSCLPCSRMCSMRAALVGRCTWFTEPFPDRSTGGPRCMPGDTAAPRGPTCGPLPPPAAPPASPLPLSGRAPGVDGMFWRRDARRFSSASVRLSKFCCDLEWSIVLRARPPARRRPAAATGTGYPSCFHAHELAPLLGATCRPEDESPPPNRPGRVAAERARA